MKHQQPVVLVVVTCGLVVAAGIMAVFQGIMHAPEYLTAYFTKVEHPIKPSYDQYDQLLKEIVKRNRVDYVAARNSANMGKALKEIASLSCDEFASDSDRLIYWINAHNLFVIKTISDRFPVASLENVSNDLNSRLYTVGGQTMTVKEIRQLKIQPLLRGTQNGDYTDCRMILLIAGGSMGYPPVTDHALTTDSVLKDMEENTYKFLHVRYSCYYDREMHTLYISPLFQWNDSTLEQTFRDPFEFVIYYMDPNDKPDVHDYHLKKAYNRTFDWRINDITTKD